MNMCDMRRVMNEKIDGQNTESVIFHHTVKEYS